MKNRTNLNLLLATLLSLITINTSQAQCPTGPTTITLTTQTQVNDFCTTYTGCTMLPADVNLLIQDDNNGLDNITNLNGLNCLISIGGDLLILSNAMLTDLTGLDNVTGIGGFLEIRFNDMLTDLTGLVNVTSIGNFYGMGLTITNNPMLSDCCILCALLAEDALDDMVIDGTIDISNNAAGCQSQADIEVCSPCTRPKVCDAEAGSF